MHIVFIMPKREHSPLTDEQKDLLRSKFVKLCPLKNACTYCSKIVSSDHIARWASHFRACKKVHEADKRAYYSLGNDPMPASKRKAFQAPLPQQYGDMIGIELVLHASLLQTMQDDTSRTTKKRKTVSSKLEAQDRAEKLAENNFNIAENLSEDRTIAGAEDIDTEFAEALAKAKSYFAAAEKQKAITVVATQGQDSLSTEKDDDLKIELVGGAPISSEGFQDLGSHSPTSETITDMEDVHSNSTTGYNNFSNNGCDSLIPSTASLHKASLTPFPDV